MRDRSRARSAEKRDMEASKMKRATAAALSLLAAAFALAGCRSASPAAPATVPVTVHLVEMAGAANGSSYSANIVPEQSVALVFKVNGYVASILQVRGAGGRLHNAQAGDRVKAGTVLAAIRDDSYRQRVLEARAQMQAAMASERKAASDFGRYTKLLQEHVVSQSDYDAARQQNDSARAQVDATRAALLRAQTDLDDCKLKSPLDGVILDRKIEVGTLVDQNAEAFKVADITSMKAVFGAPDTLVTALSDGAALSVRTEAVPGAVFDGKITRIAAVSDPDTRLFDVEVTIPNTGDRLKAGMIGVINLGALAAAAEPVVPLRAVVRPVTDPQGFAVFEVRAAAGKSYARLCKVALGAMIGDGVAVKSGVAPGDRVIVKGATIVADGQQVDVVP